MDFHTFQVLFYVVVSIIEVYKVLDHIYQKKKLAKTLDRFSKFIDRNCIDK